MGQGIVGGIFLEFKVARSWIGGFSEEFLACYELKSKEENYYVIKEDFFLKHYKEFLREFNDFYGIKTINDPYFEVELSFEDIPDFNTMEEFRDFWSKEKRQVSVPAIYDGYFEPIAGLPTLTWLFYRGTERVGMEDELSFYHFEKAISAVIKNPLGKLIRLGLY